MGVQAKRQTVECVLQMFDDCGVSGVEHSDAAVVQFQNQSSGRVNADAIAAELLLIIFHSYIMS